MAELVGHGKTSLQSEDVVVRAVQFFTSGKWRTQSQSARIATFIGRPPIPIGMIVLTVIGFAMCVVPGIIMYILVIRKIIVLQNIVVTANPIAGGSDVVITYSAAATKRVDEFLQALPK